MKEPLEQGTSAEPRRVRKPEMRLDRQDLETLLQLFLRLERPEWVRTELEKLFAVPLQALKDVLCQTKVRVTFEGYQIDLRHLAETSRGSMLVQMQFRAPMKWWHPFFDQNASLVRTLKRICISEIPDLRFAKYEHVLPAPHIELDKRRSESAVYHYHAVTFNPWWEAATDISPLIIVPSYHHGNCFVEFFFDAGAYTTVHGKTALRRDWEKYFIRDRFPDSNPRY